MKLVHPFFKMQIVLSNCFITELIIEEPNTMYDLTFDLYNQYMGNSGNFVLSKNLDILDISKVSEVILNPFQIDLNNRKITKKLYTILKNEILSTELLEDFSKISQDIYNLADKLADTSVYNLSFSVNEDAEEFLKYIKVKIQDDESTSLTEKVIDFLNISSSLLNIKLLIMLNARSFISDDNICHIYKEAMYKNVSLLLLESSAKKQLEQSKRFIIDKDLCEIYDE